MYLQQCFKGFNLVISSVMFALLLSLQSCDGRRGEPPAIKNKIGVLLVNHGSRSETWRNALLSLEANVKDTILKMKNVANVQTAFMEYTEPSIATRLKEFDKEGCTDIVIIPIFLTVSPHSFDDIPTIVGMKEDPQSMELLKIEKIERYTPKAHVHITPLLDFTDILQKNVLKRVQQISKRPSAEGLVMIAYGDETYTRQWSELLSEAGEYISRNTGISDYSFGWCGHVAHYSPDSTTAAITQILRKKENAIVVPVLVATDEAFQVAIIGSGISRLGVQQSRVLYKPDAILPDKNIENWVIQVTSGYIDKITGNENVF